MMRNLLCKHVFEKVSQNGVKGKPLLTTSQTAKQRKETASKKAKKETDSVSQVTSSVGKQRTKTKKEICNKAEKGKGGLTQAKSKR